LKVWGFNLKLDTLKRQSIIKDWQPSPLRRMNGNSNHNRDIHMQDIKKEDIVEETSTSEVEKETTEETKEETTKVEETFETETTEQDPLEAELERVKSTKGGRSEIEKATYSLQNTARRLIKLGESPSAILGIEKETETFEEDIVDEDDKPVTQGQLKKIIAASATKTALQMADDIESPTEKELVKYYVENRIVPSGDPAQDFKDARLAVNSLKNTQILEETGRKTEVRNHSNASSVDARTTETEGELSPEEKVFLGAPFNMTKEEILKTREKKA